MRRNPIHYAAMNKYTKCYKTLEALLKIDIDVVEGFEVRESLATSLSVR